MKTKTTIRTSNRLRKHNPKNHERGWVKFKGKKVFRWDPAIHGDAMEGGGACDD